MFSVSGAVLTEAINSLQKIVGKVDSVNIRVEKDNLLITTQGQNSGYVNVPCKVKKACSFAINTEMISSALYSLKEVELSLSDNVLSYSTPNKKVSGTFVTNEFQAVNVLPSNLSSVEKFSSKFLQQLKEWLPYVGVVPSVVTGNSRAKNNLQVLIKDKKMYLASGDNFKWAFVKTSTDCKDIQLDIPMEYLQTLSLFEGKKVNMAVDEGIIYMWDDTMGVGLPSLQVEASEIKLETIKSFTSNLKSDFSFTCNAEEVNRILGASTALDDGNIPRVLVKVDKKIVMSVKSNIGTMSENIDSKDVKGKGQIYWDPIMSSDVFYRCGSKITEVSITPNGIIISPKISDGKVVYGVTAWQPTK